MSSFLLSEFGGDYGQLFLPWTHFVDFLEVFILGDWSPLIFKTGVSFSRCSLAPLSSISGNPDSPPAFLVFFSTPSGGLIIQEPSPGATSGKEPACQCKRCMRCGFHPWVGKISWRRKRQPTPVFLSGKSHGRWNLVGCSPWGYKELDVTEHACTLRVAYAKRTWKRMEIKIHRYVNEALCRTPETNTALY